MGLLNFLKKKTYDFDTVTGIEQISVPKYHTLKGLESPVDNIEYILQRKATEHKKNGKMDLAIACLKKSNELMDFSNFHYAEKDYIRYIKFLRLNGQDDLADIEEQKLYIKHPEFKDKRITNLVKINESLDRQRKFKNDLVIIYTNNTCSICKRYNKKIYSISGKSKKFPKLPLEITKYGGFCPNCYLGVNSYFEGITSQPKGNV